MIWQMCILHISAKISYILKQDLTVFCFYKGSTNYSTSATKHPLSNITQLEKTLYFSRDKEDNVIHAIYHLITIITKKRKLSANLWYYSACLQEQYVRVSYLHHYFKDSIDQAVLYQFLQLEFIV